MAEIDSSLRKYAIRFFGDQALAMKWLTKPVLALGGKRPLDVDVETALEFLARLEHGFAA
ncbi:MbcA/ParS/Xre antitoxin family protein [Pseudomonas sp. LG1E9]|uniref:MbcA/ParS/Xre antitoxin family protein n=1 Tax=Pseudomonas sp. LG1E9 TaxID=2219057 RepID=UPI000DD340BE|nr:MbcA/ParS/Xre antitoxin family protein [Pseudomonas sp. LG1E9]